jgi:hypothetical protein
MTDPLAASREDFAAEWEAERQEMAREPERKPATSHLERLMAEAIPRPWVVEPPKPSDTLVWVTAEVGGLFYLPTAVGLDGRWVNSVENAALIVAAVNALPAFQQHWRWVESASQEDGFCKCCGFGAPAHDADCPHEMLRTLCERSSDE